MKLDTPNPDSAVVNGGFSTPWVAFFSKLRTFVIANSQYGTTANRPTTGLSPGDKYMDTDLGYPVFVQSVNPVVWVDGAGTVR